MEHTNEHEHDAVHEHDAHGHDEHAATSTETSAEYEGGLKKFSNWVNANSPDIPPMPSIVEPEEHGHGDHGHDAHGEHGSDAHHATEKLDFCKLKNSANTLYKIVGVITGVCLVAALLVVVAQLPIFGALDSPAINEVYTRYLEKAVEETGAVNAVAGMILDYRAFDTFGESVVLFTAVLSVSFLLNKVKSDKKSKKKKRMEG